MSKRELEAKFSLELPKLVEYLQQLADSMAGRRLYIERDGKVLALQPAEDIEVEIKARQKKGKERLCIELSWERDDTEDDKSPPELRIRGEESQTT